MTRLPPYETALACAKCRHGGIDDQYRSRPPTQLVWTAGDLSEIYTHGGNDTDGECLLRSCRACGWAWLEACADATPTRDGGDPDETSSDFYRRIGAMPCGGTYTVTSRDGRTSNPIPYNAPPGFDPGWASEACADADGTGQSARPSGDFTQRLRACPACAASTAVCITKGGRCCAMCDHQPVDNPMQSSS